MELQKAYDLACGILRKLEPVTTRRNIAGSVRRKKKEVGDIEILCQPALITLESADLFGAVTRTTQIHPEFKTVVEGLGKVVKGKPNGRYMRIWLNDTIGIDLFMPQPDDYYRQYAIRTGSRDYAHIVIAGGWKRNGWVGTDDGLRVRNECKETKTSDGKSIWTCEVKKPTVPPVWESEPDFFKWLGVPYLDPVKRSM